MDIKYYLDDKEVDGADLSGKTGKVKIVINYTNNTSLNGTKVPFVVLTGMVLENDTFQNVTVSSGKVIDDGQKSFIVGMGGTWGRRYAGDFRRRTWLRQHGRNHGRRQGIRS